MMSCGDQAGGPARENTMERIEAELLVPGSGEPVPDGVVVLDGPVISYAGPAREAPETTGAAVHRTEAVLPGMWDCHGHFFGVRAMDVGQLPLEPVPLRAARCARDLRSALDAGITSVREVGGLGVYLARAVAEGVLDGPAVYAAGAILSITGGHADLHSYPLSWISDFGHQHGELRLADGVTRAIESGVTIAMGTDIAITGPDRPNGWGSNGAELVHLVKLGMTPLQAIEAATATAPLTLGPQAPKSGRLEAGYDADVITVGADPLADISVLARPEHVTAVWTAGRRVKG